MLWFAMNQEAAFLLCVISLPISICLYIISKLAIPWSQSYISPFSRSSVFHGHATFTPKVFLFT